MTAWQMFPTLEHPDVLEGAGMGSPEPGALLTCPTGPGSDIIGCGGTFEYDPDNDDGMVDCPHCGIFFDPRDEMNKTPEPVQARTAPTPTCPACPACAGVGPACAGVGPACTCPQTGAHAPTLAGCEP